MTHQPVLLIILDGWGIRQDPTANAIIEAHPSFYEQLLRTYPMISLDASGEAVGLPEGQMGNSEVGHLNMGAGRVIYQSLTQIDKAIKDGDFFQNPVLHHAIAHAKQNNSTLHLMGLVSDGGVHSSQNHLLALIDMAKKEGIEKLRVHAFLDGRDVPPQSATTYLDVVEQHLLKQDYPQIATICGRYYAMDRDKRWDRIQKAYENLVIANGTRLLFSQDALAKAYHNEETDEFVSPAVCDLTYEGMEDGDSIIFFNFRPDRARQLTRAFVDPNFTGFPREKVLQNLLFTGMALYDETLPIPIAFEKQTPTQILAEVISQHGIQQFHTAETEKYAHVTYFFNGGIEAPFPGETRKMIPSPKVATYDLQPEMSLPLVEQEVIHAVQSQQYEFVVTNFANPDMVGHTGKMDAALLAVTAVDKALHRIITTALNENWVVLLTADHGNIEMMKDKDGEPHTAHTTDLVPLFLIANQTAWTLDNTKVHALSSIAPTVLALMGLPIPTEMTSPSLLTPKTAPIAHNV